MMGMGFLRLNKLLAEHKWNADKEVTNKERDRRERRRFVIALVIVAILVTVGFYLAS